MGESVIRYPVLTDSSEVIIKLNKSIYTCNEVIFYACNN